MAIFKLGNRLLPAVSADGRGGGSPVDQETSKGRRTTRGRCFRAHETYSSSNPVRSGSRMNIAPIRSGPAHPQDQKRPARDRLDADTEQNRGTGTPLRLRPVDYRKTCLTGTRPCMRHSVPHSLRHNQIERPHPKWSGTPTFTRKFVNASFGKSQVKPPKFL